MPTVQVLGAKGQKTGTLELKPDVFGVEIRVPLLHQAVTRELADRRAGTHDTKGRSEVSGGGRKPWRQKGTGRARQGSIRAPQWKGGGKPFGPTPRSYAQDMPREMRRQALRAAVAAKIAAGELKAIEALDVVDGKTKPLVTRLAALGLGGAPTLLVVASLGEVLWRAARNVAWLTVETPLHVSVHQLLGARQAVFERGALLALEEALSPEGGSAPRPGSIVGAGLAAPSEPPQRGRVGKARARKAAADQGEVAP
jgi:large subunit ribosomal protein L4